MPDRKTVMSWLEGLTQDDWQSFYSDSEVQQIAMAALELLKDQEAVEPIKPLDKDDDYTFMCSNCKGELFCGDIIRDNFCPTCGKPVKWE